ncbi:MAG: recombinase family protein [Anaerolineales bacterium]|nr:recombinase family protein [Anaerolineales bacterium]
MTKRAILYARVSSDDRKNEGRNLISQLDMCRKYAKEKGWHIVAELAEDDKGASGASYHLPQLNEAVEMAHNGNYDVLVVREIDRLSRDIGKQFMIEGELKRNNVNVVYVLGEYPDTPEGNLNKAIKSAIASYERTKINERMIRGRRREIRRGSIIVHGRVPYGYDLIHNGDKYQLIINEKQAVIIRLIYQWYTVGEGKKRPYSIRKICQKLDEAGVPTPTSKSKKWSHATVSRFLISETYIGVWRYGKYGRTQNGRKKNPNEHTITAEVPAIVDLATWEIAQKRRQANKEKSRRNQKHNYLLSKQVQCVECGAKMTASLGGGNKSSKYYQYYRCMAGLGYRDYSQECHNKYYYRSDYVDEIAWQWVKTIFLEPEKLEEGYSLYLQQIEATLAPLYQRLDLANELIHDAQQKLDRLLDLYLSGNIEKDLLVDRKHRLETTLEALQKEREEINIQIEASQVTKEQIQTVMEFAGRVENRFVDIDEEDDFEVKRHIIEALNVQAKLNFEDEEKVVYLSCALGQEALFVVSNQTYKLRKAKSRSPAPAHR